MRSMGEKMGEAQMRGKSCNQSEFLAATSPPQPAFGHLLPTSSRGGEALAIESGRKVGARDLSSNLANRVLSARGSSARDHAGCKRKLDGRQWLPSFEDDRPD